MKLTLRVVVPRRKNRGSPKNTPNEESGRKTSARMSRSESGAYPDTNIDKNLRAGSDSVDRKQKHRQDEQRQGRYKNDDHKRPVDQQVRHPSRAV